MSYFFGVSSGVFYSPVIDTVLIPVCSVCICKCRKGYKVLFYIDTGKLFLLGLQRAKQTYLSNLCTAHIRDKRYKIKWLEFVNCTTAKFLT